MKGDVRRASTAAALFAALAWGTPCGWAQDQGQPEAASPYSVREDAPLWEVGMGATGLRLPYFRGSDQSRYLVLPLPYFVYRGNFLRSDREGVRGVLFDSTSLTVNVSAGAALPVPSHSSDTRGGMPDLKPEVEIGPAVDWTIWRGENRGTRFRATLPLRAAISVDWPPRALGWITNPYLNLDLTDPQRVPGWNLGLQAGPVFASRSLNGYYYSVAPAFATPTRPAYSAPGGYSGFQLTTALSKRFPAYWLGGFFRYDSVGGSVFEDSPIIRSRYSLYGGIGVAIMIRESSVRVPRREDDY